MSVAVAVNDLRFAYADGGFELRLPAWTVNAGMRVAVMGPSGCGKSTLLNLIGGVIPLTSGRLEVCGTSLSGLSDAERRRHRIQQVGFIFQDFPLVDYLNVVENVLLPYRVNPVVKLDNDARKRALSLLDTLEVGQLARRQPKQLSQGERQRVAIARALVTQPRLLLADEPTAGLDSRRSDLLLGLISELTKELGLTMVMVTHDRKLCDGLDDVLDLGEPT